MRNMSKVLGGLPINQIIQNQNGTWGFVGRVDARLLYVYEDGKMPTVEDVAVARSGFPPKGLKRRVYKTKSEAENALAELTKEAL